jgi:hypothetical protein
LVAALVAIVPACASGNSPTAPTGTLTGVIADAPTYVAVADGDLWANCWGADGAVYAANGDGSAFGAQVYDVAVSRIDGDLDDLHGETLAGGDAIAPLWSGTGFTRKPTGMLCRDGVLYLAVQDLASDFNEAPAATIVRSIDGGHTWQWDASGPMFSDHAFTTVFFLDYGRDSGHAPDSWVYAYGLDGNWRDSYSDVVADPQDLYLARVPHDSVLDRSKWEFFAGFDGQKPTWTPSIADRVPVLHDERRRYPDGGDFSVLSQGGVVYIPGLSRYVYTSWTELTFEFYESSAPWGPFRPFLSRDFGPYPWTADVYGGYATTIPSKFISDDGQTMWVQSNVCPCAPAGMSSYYFGLRKLELAVQR